MSSLNLSSCIQIRITRNDDPSNDDRIVIKYIDVDTYELYYQDGDMVKPVVYTTVLTGDQLDIYMESLFGLLSRDTDPFESINFMIPCFPVVQFTIQDLRKQKIRDALQRIMPILHSAHKY